MSKEVDWNEMIDKMSVGGFKNLRTVVWVPCHYATAYSKVAGRADAPGYTG